MKRSRLTAILLTSLAIAGCGETPNGSAPEASVDAPKPDAAASTPANSPVESLSRNVVADNIPFQPTVAKIDGNAIASTGSPGYMMYGPYVAFAPGTYRATVKGSIPSLKNGAEVHFDAVASKAASILGSQVVKSTVPSSGTIAEFDFTVAEAVSDLELRAEVTEGASVRIESYTIARKQ
ncbi:hypothetical protein [Lysobacter sp. HA18]